MSSTPDTFRFLDLPPELRLLVYEYLPNRTRCSKFIRTLSSGQTSTFKLFTTCPPSVAILLTCSLIYQEAKGILAATAKKFLETDLPGGPAPRIEADVDALLLLTKRNGLVQKVITRYDIFRLQTRMQPRRFGQSGAVTSLASSIREKGYRLDHDATDDVLEVEYFIAMAACSLLQQKRNMNQTRTSSMLDFHVALHKTSEEGDLEFVQDLAASILDYSRTLDRNGVIAYLHLLKDADTSAEDQAHVWGLMQQCRMSSTVGVMRSMFLGQDRINKRNSTVYETLWQEGEWP